MSARLQAGISPCLFAQDGRSKRSDVQDSMCTEASESHFQTQTEGHRCLIRQALTVGGVAVGLVAMFVAAEETRLIRPGYAAGIPDVKPVEYEEGLNPAKENRVGHSEVHVPQHRGSTPGPPGDEKDRTERTERSRAKLVQRHSRLDATEQSDRRTRWKAIGGEQLDHVGAIVRQQTRAPGSLFSELVTRIVVRRGRPTLIRVE